jgi:hypothetical protein
VLARAWLRPEYFCRCMDHLNITLVVGQADIVYERVPFVDESYSFALPYCFLISI